LYFLFSMIVLITGVESATWPVSIYKLLSRNITYILTFRRPAAAKSPVELQETPTAPNTPRHRAATPR
jgi:hypothetical protein